MEGGVEEELAPGGARLGEDRRELLPRLPDAVGVDGEELPPTWTVPERKRCPVRCALRRRARSVSPAKRLLPAARPTPAQTAAMSLRWFQVRSSSSRMVRTRASSAVVPRPSASSQASAYETVFATEQAAQARAA